MLARTLAVAFALQSFVFAAPAGPRYVDACDPCSIVLHEGAPPADFRFELASLPEGRVVKAIIFERNGQPVQRLPIPSMTPRASDEQFFFGGQDINFDGWLDLLLMTEQGAANASAEYWVYDPAADRFRDLGQYPMLRVDPATKRLSSYVSNGPAGLDFEAREYAFEGNDLTVTSEETQKPSIRRPGMYVSTIRRRKSGKMVVVQRRTVRPPAP